MLCCHELATYVERAPCNDPGRHWAPICPVCVCVCLREREEERERERKERERERVSVCVCLYMCVSACDESGHHCAVI